MKFLVAVALVASASAFAPVRQTRRPVKSAPQMSVFDNYVGGSGGFGEYNFDPLGFAEKSPEMVPWYREAELKHGRIAMLATLGYSAVSLGLHLPGPMYEGISPANAHNAFISNGPMQQLLLWIGVFETIIGIPALKATMNGERAPGDFNFGTTFAPTDPAKFKQKQLAELKNGRLAMLAFGGMVTQAQLTGNEFPFFY
jgi:hypothetical protein